MPRTRRVAALLTAAASLALALPVAAAATPVIVDLAPGADPSVVAASVGVVPEVVFTEDGAGFAADVSSEQQARLRRTPAVTKVGGDRIVGRIAATGRRAVLPEQPEQTVKVALQRVGVLLSPTADVDGRDDRRVDVDIAIFDTGIDKRHPDLNVAGGVDCARGKGWDDFDGHGTLVGGFAGAIDNHIGVVGTSPGARLWAVRIVDPDLNIRESALRCGLEWLIHKRGAIEVANFSFSEGDPYVGPCGRVGGKVLDRQHHLVCKAVDAGITIVAAAGNDAWDAGTVSPSAWPEVITASAVSETDGLPGGLGPVPVCLEGQLDDHMATFSNFGSAVEIAAPGVCVTSTYPGGLYAYDSGTSYASPIVAGGAGLIKAKHPNASPWAVRTRLLAAAEPGPIPGDPDGFPEGLLNVAGF